MKFLAALFERSLPYLRAAHRAAPEATNPLFGTLYILSRPGWRRGLPTYLRMLLMSPMVSSRPGSLPAPESALRHPEGLLGVGGRMTVRRLVAAYRQGIYPWAHAGPVQWWSPRERFVLFLDEFKINRRFRSYLRKSSFRITTDKAFVDVVRGCAEPRSDSLPFSWITRDFRTAFTQLHRHGFAHSVEVWDGEELVGGVYGVALGRLFFTESMFARRQNASKIALTHLHCQLAAWGIVANDVKRESPFWASLGGRHVPRADLQALCAGADRAPIGKWSLDRELDVAGWRPGSDSPSA